MTSKGSENVEHLSTKQERFCTLYAETGNATQSYREAYSGGLMSDPTAAACSSRLLRNVKIMRRIRELRDEAARPKIRSISEVQAKLSELIVDPKTGAGTRVSAAKVLLQSLGAFERQSMQQQINVFSNSSEDVQIVLPALIDEKYCQADYDGEPPPVEWETIDY